MRFNYVDIFLQNYLFRKIVAVGKYLFILNKNKVLAMFTSVWDIPFKDTLYNKFKSYYINNILTLINLQSLLYSVIFNLLFLVIYPNYKTIETMRSSVFNPLV